MPRSFGYTIKLRAGAAPEYVAAHRAVPEPVLAGLRAAGVRGMRIFRAGTTLFMYVEADDGFDPEHGLEAIARQPGSQEWNVRMGELQAPREGEAAPAWRLMEDVFDLPGA